MINFRSKFLVELEAKTFVSKANEVSICRNLYIVIPYGCFELTGFDMQIKEIKKNYNVVQI